MALSYGFYNSSGGDRRYNAEQMSSIFNYLITEGVLSSIGEHFAVVPGQGRQVLVKSGWAWFDSTWTYNDSTIPLNLEAPDISVDRIDAVVIETNKNLDVRANAIKIITGSPSSSPQKPVISNTSAISQHAIAYVTVKAGMTSVGLTDIEIVVGKDECPFITSILQSTSISDLFNQWEGEFNTWFEHIQVVLSEEVVTNLYAEIDKRVKIADKATNAEATAGTSTTKWMTPATTKAEIDGMKATNAEATAGTSTTKWMTPATTKSAINELGLQIQVGSYVGTGGVGSSNPNTISCDFAIKFLWVFGFMDISYNEKFYSIPLSTGTPFTASNLLTTSYVRDKGMTAAREKSGIYSHVKRNSTGTAISWYISASVSNTPVASQQLNSSDNKYFWIALG